MKTIYRILSVGVLFVGVCLMSSCESPKGYMASDSSTTGWSPIQDGRSYSPSDETGSRGGVDQERLGLATSLGRTRNQDLRTVKFFRRANTPDGVASFHYNDDEGAKAMASLVGIPRKRSGEFKQLDGQLSMALRETRWSGLGDAYPWYESGGKVFVIGERGDEYSIVLENRTPQRAEFVVSVDGRSVLGGGAASMKQRGYVVEPKSKVTIKGLRIDGKVRSFQFGGVNESHAKRAGGDKAARNVGVVGVAVFYEDAAARKQAMANEGMKRDEADTFPES